MNNIIHNVYDCIIIGGGISGFYCALELQRKNPKWSIAIIEKYKGIGGRTYTYKPRDFPGIQWEMGAGRVSTTHKMTMGLLKKYKLNVWPIDDKSMYIRNAGFQLENNRFESASIQLFIEPLKSLPQEILENNTLFKLLTSVYGLLEAKKIVSPFPYWAEVHSLRADLALKMFLTGEMRTNKGYVVLKEGFSELIHRMSSEFKDNGGVVLTEMSVTGIKNEDDLTAVFVDSGKKGEIKKVEFKAKMCVVAVHSDGIKKIGGINKMPMLKYVKTAPLFRVYAIFPSPAWFKDLPKIVTGSCPRYIIPINAEKGVIMISYTDGNDTNHYHAIWKKGGDKALQVAVMSDIRKLFPTYRIPEPKFFRGHYWDTGATYWQPGHYNPDIISISSCYPLPLSLPRVFVTGESFSIRQAWVEGALEQSKICLGIIDKCLADSKI